MLFLGPLLGGCGGDPGPGETAVPVPVEAVVAVADTVSVTLRSVGSLEADAQVEMRAEAEGRVTRILFEEGQAVTRGQPLLLLDQEKLRAELEAARATEVRTGAEAANLRRQVDRNRGLLADGAISRQAFDDLVTRFESAEARRAEAKAAVSLARERLADATVRAPFTGRAGERVVDLGDFLKRGDSLLMLVDDDTLEISFSVPERYVGRLGAGKPVTLRVQSYPERRFGGSVTYVSPVVDRMNRTVRLKARVPNRDGALRSGQFANVTLGLERKENAVLVPEAAVVPQAGRAYVFVVSDGVAHRQAVGIGERSPGWVEMASGVRAGDTVVVAGQQKIRDGSAVAPKLRPLRLELEGAGAKVTQGDASGSAAADPGSATAASSSAAGFERGSAGASGRGAPADTAGG